MKFQVGLILIFSSFVTIYSSDWECPAGISWKDAARWRAAQDVDSLSNELQAAILRGDENSVKFILEVLDLGSKVLLKDMPFDQADIRAYEESTGYKHIENILDDLINLAQKQANQRIVERLENAKNIFVAANHQGGQFSYGSFFIYSAPSDLEKALESGNDANIKFAKMMVDAAIFNDELHEGDDLGPVLREEMFAALEKYEEYMRSHAGGAAGPA
ncbi:hypothetical protein A3F66_00400 [candidate division TM6 bacterium RIFCSPHIGHO2_12_FULL_32_22]|nr:MAG: hypothetical protein A3F66_00400 [candidate division TM6 bacterium RIFCSPHIGHO2_12_FULL_32_22]